MKQRITWTFEPDADVQSLLAKEMTRLRGRNGKKRGLRTTLINDALREMFKANRGKREQVS